MRDESNESRLSLHGVFGTVTAILLAAAAAPTIALAEMWPEDHVDTQGLPAGRYTYVISITPDGLDSTHEVDAVDASVMPRPERRTPPS